MWKRPIPGDELHDGPCQRGYHEQQEGADVVARLFQEPHGHDGSKENISEDDVQPGHAVQVNRQVDADIEHGDQEDDGDDEAYFFTGIELLDEQDECLVFTT